ncbi:MAG: AMP-binding protein [Cytophagales bacterium]|nr:AMP-binding protein [Cytophagales bacterium]
MIITIQGQQLTSDQIGNGRFEKKEFSQDSQHLLDFIQSWTKGKRVFTFETSGSTSKPKKIQLTKEILVYSAKETLKYLNFDDRQSNAFLLPISPKFIGGMMVAVRALVSNSDLTVIDPQLTAWPEGSYFTGSFVPLQIQKILQSENRILESIDNILIGGAALDPALEERLLAVGTRFYHTYGMTETASHVALRRLGESAFRAIGDAQFELNNEQQLTISGTVTGKAPLTTNDLVEIQDKQTFIWKGRGDFVINSGGFKIQPERVEAILSEQLDVPFVISSIPDAKFGHKVVLIVEGHEQPLHFDELHSYEKPKALFFGHQIARTASGKLDRNQTRANLLKQINA